MRVPHKHGGFSTIEMYPNPRLFKCYICLTSLYICHISPCSFFPLYYNYVYFMSFFSTHGDRFSWGFMCIAIQCKFNRQSSAHK